ncbi:MAG: glycosyltransferase 87 family protein [Acidobacteriaceae bacterium]|nr:glycosyltransferase 87 family protein [Acidobacteriaceae bacterium]
MRIVFVALLLQLQLIVFASLGDPRGIVFVRENYFGLDLLDFINAANDWLRGFNPYERLRFVTPPPTLIVGLVFHKLSLVSANIAFLLVNLVAVFASVWMVCGYFRMRRSSRLLMMAITSLYYPFMFLLERGNLDGIMLLLICSAIVVRNRTAIAILLAISIVFKVYSLVLALVIFTARRFSVIVAVIVFSALFVLPFHSLLHPYIAVALGRTQQFTAVENLSPAVILGSLCKHMLGKIIFVSLWLMTLLSACWRHRELPIEERLIVCFPWMAAFPLQVYPYSGVLLLPVLVWQLGSTYLVENLRARWVFLVGFILVGTQQGALNEYFQWAVRSHRFFPLLNVIGMICVLTSLAFFSTVGDCSPHSIPATTSV